MTFIKALTPERLRQLWYVPLLTIAMGLMMLRALVFAKILDVPSFAEYSAAQLLSSTFCMLGALGLQYLLQREMPIQFVSRRDRAAVVLLMQGLLVTFGCATVGWLIAALGVSVANLSFDLMCIAVLHGLSQQWFLLVTVESRSRGHPLLFARQTLERAAFVLLVGIVAGLLLDSAAAVLLGEAVVSIVLSLKIMPSILRRAKIKATTAVYLAMRHIRQLPWPTAMALLLLMSVTFLFLNADRWFAAALLQPSAFALYSFAWILLAVAQSLQAIINASAYPLLARKYAQFGSSAAFRIAATISSALLILGVLLLWPAHYLIGEAIAIWFPKYVEAQSISSLLLLLAVFRLSDFWGSYLVIIGKEKLLLGVYVVIGVAVIGLWLAVIHGEVVTIETIAWLAFVLTFAGYLAAFCTALFLRGYKP